MMPSLHMVALDVGAIVGDASSVVRLSAAMSIVPLARQVYICGYRRCNP